MWKAIRLKKYQSHPMIGTEFTMDYNSQQSSLAAGDRHDIWEREFQEDLLLLVHKVDPGPVDGHDDVVLREAGACGEDTWGVMLGRFPLSDRAFMVLHGASGRVSPENLKAS